MLARQSEIAGNDKPMKRKDWAIHFIYAGILLLLAGTQMHAVEAYRLTPSATAFLAKNFGPGPETTQGALNHLMVNGAQVRKTVDVPTWIAWAALSGGAVMAIHGALLMAQKK